MTTSNKHKTKSVNVKYVDQCYGKSTVNKDGLLSLRVLSLKLQSSMMSSLVLAPDVSMGTRKEKFDENDMIAKIFDDRQSQSQSSSQCLYLFHFNRFGAEISRTNYKGLQSKNAHNETASFIKMAL